MDLQARSYSLALIVVIRMSYVLALCFVLSSVVATSYHASYPSSSQIDLWASCIRIIASAIVMILRRLSSTRWDMCRTRSGGD